jgi:hypothetical protein
MTAGLFSLLCLVGTAQVDAAPATTGKVDVGVNVSGVLHSDADTGNALGISGRAAYGLNEWVAVGLEVGHYGGADVAVEEVALGDLSGVAIFSDILLRFPNESQILPYGVLGIGGVFWNFDDSDLVESAGLETKVDDSFAVKLGAGFDWFINEHWAINFEAAYVFADTTVHAVDSSTGDTLGSEEGSLDHWVIGAGVKFLF